MKSHNFQVNPLTGAQEELSAAPSIFPRHTVSIRMANETMLVQQQDLNQEWNGS